MNAVGDKIFVIGGYRKVSDDEIIHSPSEVQYLSVYQTVRYQYGLQ